MFCISGKFIAVQLIDFEYFLCIFEFQAMISIGISFIYAVLTSFIGYHEQINGNDEISMFFRNNVMQSLYHITIILFFIWKSSEVTSEVSHICNLTCRYMRKHDIL